MIKLNLIVLFISLSCLLLLASGLQTIKLTNWQLQSSNTTAGFSGKDISKPTYNASKWYSVRVPCTVMDGLIQNNVYSNEKLYHGTYLNNITREQFNASWWYRTQVNLNKTTVKKDQRVILTFKGVNYRANLWINGVKIANQTSLVGAFRYFEFDVTSFVKHNVTNVVAIEIIRPNDEVFPWENNSSDLGISFIDWAPTPPDSSMGLWREVELTILDGPVSVRYPSVETKLEYLSPIEVSEFTTTSDEIEFLDHKHAKALLTVMVEVTNHLHRRVSGIVKGSIHGLATFSQIVTLQPRETRQVIFSHTRYSQLRIRNPKLWWPKQMGTPHLHNLTFEFTATSGVVTDRLNQRFGIREITDKLNVRGHRVYYVNHKPILIRGAGWSPDLLLRKNTSRLQAELRYVLDMGLNSIRLEGKLEHDEFFDFADELGILVLSGWACCDAWQHWPAWQAESYFVAQESLRSEVKRLRIHASNLMFMYSSDMLPPARVEQSFLNVFKEERWPNPILASASDLKSNITGPTGVKMSGPYSWVPPHYWLNDTSKFGGAFSFLTEGGPGENPMTVESLAKTIDEEKLWPPNSDWDYHCGHQQGHFGSLRYFNPPLNARYGPSNSAREYLYKSSAATYEAHRAMFEAYSRNKYVSTGLIQWMLNNAMPQMIWHLYDYYLNPDSAYFASKKSMEPIHPMYSYNDGSIWLINSDYHSHRALSVSAEVYNLDATKVYEFSVNVSHLASDSTVRLFDIPANLNVTKSYFLRLNLKNLTSNAVITRNSYWLSTVPDVLDWSNTTFYTTFCTSFADFTDLQTLPEVKLNVSSVSRKAKKEEISNPPLGKGAELKTDVTVSNPSKSIALLVSVKLVRSTDGERVLPILWSDNYFTLLPGESQTVTATYNSDSLDGGAKALPEVQVWNNVVRPHATTLKE